MSTKYGKVVTYREGLPFINSHSLLNTRLRIKWKAYLHYHNAYGHHKFKWPRNEVVL